jgi:release factor glutamine methyltransferase
MISLMDIIKRSEKYLSQRGVERARREAEEVIADVLGIKRLDLYLQFERPMESLELGKLREAIKRRASRIPVAYIAGHVSFLGARFIVSPDVLIPRPETEILVEKIAQQLEKAARGAAASMDSFFQTKTLWDMCCGSGCIGLSLKARFPTLNVILSDLSEEALAIAQENARYPVTFLQGDLFTPFTGRQCDYFVCNPPYVSEKDYLSLTEEVKKEPKMALVSGASGYEFYIRIARELKKHLKIGGLGWLELGTGQGEKVKKIFELEGWSCHYEADWAGHDRFLYIL